VEYVQKLTSTRAGTIALATLAALLAGGAILVYLNNYRHSVSAEGAPVTVLVAKHTISKGTPGTAIAAAGLFTKTTLRQSQLREGAFSDPASLHGEVAAHDIYPGQQLTAADFVGGTNSLASSLTKAQRVITIPIDSAHGLIGAVQAGDHVDVFAGFNVVPVRADGTPKGTGQARPILRLIMQNIPVLAVGGKVGGGLTGGGAAGTVTLRATAAQTEQLAFASDNGKIWLVLRPSRGGRLVRPGIVTVETMLLGVPPITVLHSLGGR
jgi:Flp pilus assembly protein CpaB